MVPAQVTFIITLYTIQIVSKQLYCDNRKMMQTVHFGCKAALKANSVIVQFSVDSVPLYHANADE